MEPAAQNPDPATLEWWTLRELAIRWKVSRETLRRQCEAGQLVAMIIGSQYRIHNSVIRQREAAAKVQAVATARQERRQERRDRRHRRSRIDHFAGRE
jgi:hypothetical protein